MANLRERKKADTRTRLSVAAVELLVAEGAERATVSAIAGRAGVSTRTFHNYFAHREDAFMHFLREQIAECVQWVEQAPAEMPPMAALRTMYREFHGRTGDDISAAGNLLMAGEQIGLLLGTDRRFCAEDILDPLYEAVGRRAPELSRFRVRTMVDLSLAAVASVLRHQRAGGAAGDDAASDDTAGGGTASDGAAAQHAPGDPWADLDEALDLLEFGAGRAPAQGQD